MIILKQTSGSVILVKKAEFTWKVSVCSTPRMVSCLPTLFSSLPHVPTVTPIAALGNLVRPCRMHTCAFSIPGGHRGIWCLEEPMQGTMLSSSPVSASLAHKGAESFQWASAVVCPLRIHPLCFLQSSRADHSFLMPLPHASIGKNQDLQSHHRPSQGHLALGLSGPDFSSGRRPFLM